MAVRVFHWSLVTTVVVAWFSGGVSPRWHEIAGYIVLGLVAFRIAWGFGGTRHALFEDFVTSPWAILAYLRQLATHTAPRTLGHNPAGGAMILTLLGLLLVICGTGWLMGTRRLFGVPWVEDVHAYAADALAILVPLHVAGVVLSSWLHRENLVLAMITGCKPVVDGRASERRPTATATTRLQRQARQGLALLMLLAASGAAYGWITTSRRVSTSFPAPPAASDVRP